LPCKETSSRACASIRRKEFPGCPEIGKTLRSGESLGFLLPGEKVLTRARDRGGFGEKKKGVTRTIRSRKGGSVLKARQKWSLGQRSVAELGEKGRETSRPLLWLGANVAFLYEKRRRRGKQNIILGTISDEEKKNLKPQPNSPWLTGALKMGGKRRGADKNLETAGL